MNELKPEDVMRELERFALDLGATRSCDALVLVEKVRTIIREKDAEIERLTAINKVLKDNNHQCHRLGYEDGITEFAERLKAEAVEVDVSMGYGNECWQKAVTEWEIDQIAKEMKGETHG